MKRVCLSSSVVIALAMVFAAPAFAQNSKILFTQRDRIVTFDLTPPVAIEQPLGGAVGAQVGTAAGALNGTTVVNFKFTFTSNPFVRPLTYSFDNRVGITDVDGDQIIFRNVGTGTFNLPLLDPSLSGNPGDSPFQVFGNGTGGPSTGTYEVLATSGKYVTAYPVGTTFPYRAVLFNPATPPTPPGTTGTSYVEVLTQKSK
jgi:hypothetical protein